MYHTEFSVNMVGKFMILHNFIVFEGIDGSGTSTQMELLRNRLSSSRTFFTAEPTSGETGKFLRRILHGEICIHPDTAAYLFAADRCEHVHGENGIIQAIQDDTLVVSDRYLFSSLAYQTPECGAALPRLLNEPFPLPEYLFFFDIDPAISLERIRGRGVTEIYEKKDFLDKTTEEYHRILEEFAHSGMNIIILDASEPADQVHEKIWTIIKKLPIVSK
jgi:dTMP kinase